ncbi:MAG: hypothetical protein BZ136_07395 [Methanosphaera sp. rholeuAM74]|nr:MAG: hypothetical protein BZ136_07395 [Methanosphaera sp. rholeuAM74]
MNYTCPACDRNISNTSKCPYCSCPIIIVNGECFHRQDYYEVEKFHNSLDSFIESSKNSINLIRNEMTDEDIYYDINANPEEKSYILEVINSTRKNTSDFKNSLDETYYDLNKLNYIKSFDNAFEPIEAKINECYQLIDVIDSVTTVFMDKITEFENKVRVPDEAMVKQLHDSCDNLLKDFGNVDKEIIKNLYEEESVEILRYDENMRDMIKSDLESTILSINGSKEEFIGRLADEMYMKYASCYDYKYGCLKDKMTMTVKSIETTSVKLEKALSFILGLEDDHNDSDTVDYSGSPRRLDL